MWRHKLDNTFVPAKTVVWAAGVAASPLASSLDVSLDRAGRVPVQPDLSVPRHPDIFVAGDLAAVAPDRRPMLLNWFWAYWSYQRGARIILGRDEDQAGSTRQA